MDEFSEKFQTAFDPPPYFRKIMKCCQSFGDTLTPHQIYPQCSWGVLLLYMQFSLFVLCPISSVLDKYSVELKVLADVVIKIQKKRFVAVKKYHHHHHVQIIGLKKFSLRNLRRQIHIHCHSQYRGQCKEILTPSKTKN